MAKFTADEKIQIVLRYLNGNESYREMRSEEHTSELQSPE